MQISSASMFGSLSGAGQLSAPTTPSTNTKRPDPLSDDTPVSGARAEFSKYMKMTPEEKMHAAILSQMGVSEEEYKAMGPDQRAAIDAKIKEKIKEQVEGAARDEGKTGLLADVTV